MSGQLTLSDQLEEIAQMHVGIAILHRALAAELQKEAPDPFRLGLLPTAIADLHRRASNISHDVMQQLITVCSAAVGRS